MSDHSGVFREEGFGRKVGPLPIWGWAIVLAAVAFIYVRFVMGRSSSSGASSAATNVPNVMTTGGYLPPSSGSGSQSLGTPPPLFTDNTSWENAAIGGASQYGTDPITLQQALDAYLHGGSITQSQQSLISRIIGAIGPAPLGTQGTPTVTNPTQPASTGKLISFIRSPNGSIAALFDNGTISEYNNMTQYGNAANKAGGVPLVGVSAQQYGSYTKGTSNYVPGS